MKKSELKEIIKEELEKFMIDRGTILKKDGIPFYIDQNTEILTTPGNARIMNIDEDQLMSDKEWNEKIANIKKGIEDMNKAMDKAKKKGDKKTLKYYMDQADKMKKILNK